MEELARALKPYVEKFLEMARQPGLKTVPVHGDLRSSGAALGLQFKTSFGQGSQAVIPWLACLFPGQTASVEGVYPVLLFHRNTEVLSVVYGVSETSESSLGQWPRKWPVEMVRGLSNYGDRKYASSYVLKEYASPTSSDAATIVADFLKVITDFKAIPFVKSVIPKPSTDLVSGFHAATAEAGLALESSLCHRTLAALAAKRLCILTGLAGSGKTKLAEALAMWLSESPSQFKLVAVGADCTSNEPLFGYADALQEALYRKPSNGALDLLLAADANPSKPHFLILDEMNLSHVERYFADVLSAIESRNAQLALHSHTAKLKSTPGGAPDVPPALTLPRNLFIIGTVNVDETTYMFSPKVLDRANVIEFRATSAQLSQFLEDPQGLNLGALLSEFGQGLGASFGEGLVQLATDGVDLNSLGEELAGQFKRALLEVFDLLAKQGAEFGFRSAHEMVRFAVIHQSLGEAGTWKLSDALDAQVLQKLMPRLHGSARKLEKVLSELDAFCIKHALPNSREKIARMQRRLNADGFASFAEN